MGEGIIKAFEDGLNNKINPGEPEKKNIYDAMKDGKEVDKLPMTLGEAIDRLNSDDIIKSALPEDMLRVFNHYKGKTLCNFAKTVWKSHEMDKNFSESF